MNRVYLLIGVLLLAVAVIDLLWTTLWVDGGAGPLSARLTTLLWRGVRGAGSWHSRMLSLAGPLILIATLLMWVALIWAGWTFLFAGGESALIDTRDKDSVTWAERIYFVAYTMFTMGNGDFSPNGSVWQIATSLTTASGMLFVTMSVSYVLSVLGAVSQKRSFASGVTGLGERSEQFLQSGWDKKDFHALDLPLSTLSSQLSTLEAQHKAYPILHYYHSETPTNASAMAVAILDEALTILHFGVPGEHRPNAALIKNARSSIQAYLETLNSAFIKPAEHAPPPPDLGRLRSAGIPVFSKETFSAALSELGERRRKLLGMIEADAWHWPSAKS